MDWLISKFPQLSQNFAYLWVYCVRVFYKKKLKFYLFRGLRLKKGITRKSSNTVTALNWVIMKCHGYCTSNKITMVIFIGLIVTPLYNTSSMLFCFLFRLWRSFRNIVGDEELLELDDSAVTSLLLRRELPGELLGVVNVDKLGAPGLFRLTFKVTIPLRIVFKK